MIITHIEHLASIFKNFFFENTTYCVLNRWTKQNRYVYNNNVKTYTYPIVFILNDETKMYNGYIPDLAICAEGKTLEDVIAEAQALMTKFFELVIKYGTDIPEPTSLEKTYDKWKGYKVMYVTANIK